MTPRLLDVAEVALLLGVSRARCYELLRAGALPCVRLGERQLRISQAALDEFIEAGGSPTPTPPDA